MSSVHFPPKQLHYHYLLCYYCKFSPISCKIVSSSEMASTWPAVCLLKFQKYKRMILVLVWSFSALVILNFLGISHHNNKIFNSSFNSPAIFGATTLLYPVLGWIADVYWGRYKMIRRSLWMMWLTAIAFCLVAIIPDNLPHADTVRESFNVALFVIMSLFLGGLQANILQFGIDQLPDASSADVISFSHWYIWLWHVGGIIVFFSQNCVCLQHRAFAKLLLPASLTLALCLDYIFSHWLIVEPPSENPLKLMYRVMCFSWKNKYPRQRSAFTYWEDKRYSRTDLAKQKFGGPFTTEQVEDVKTFWRILVIVIICCLFSSFYLNIQSVIEGMRYHLEDTNFKHESETSCSLYVIDCFQRMAVYHTDHFMVIISIPLYRLITVHHLFKKLSILMRMNIGFLLAWMRVFGYFSIEIVGHIKLNNTTNVTCLLESNERDYDPSNSIPLDYKWIMLPNLVYAFSVLSILSSALQFICAQSPYSMKGLLFGVSYGFLGGSVLISYFVLLPVKYIAHKVSSAKYGCGVWYLLIASILLLFMLGVTCFLNWRYKKRQRDDLQHNEHMFAINYYERYTLYNAVDS